VQVDLLEHLEHKELPVQVVSQEHKVAQAYKAVQARKEPQVLQAHKVPLAQAEFKEL
jgi:hypothetical protein